LRQTKRLSVIVIAVLLLVTVVQFNASAESPTACGASSVAITALNIRSSADTAAPVTATLRKGDVVVVLNTVDDIWYYVNYNGTEGYAAAMYMSDVVPAEDFSTGGTVTGDDVRMRTEPSTDGDVLDTYPDGTVMHVLGIDNGWYKVTYADQTGYIRSDFMDITCRDSDVPADAALSIGQEIAEYAMQFAGYRYVYGASSPAVGFDCSGFTYYIYGRFGYALSRTASQQFRNNGRSVSKDNLQPGDLLFFSSNGGASVTHVGLYIGDGLFVHASTSRTGVIISSLESSYYTRVWYGAKRIV
jgi:cell wall-associated NlpC family hydrolase